MNDELVSVIIPTYNMAKLLPDALESARTQTYDNIEVIVIDDGSTDNTTEIVSRYFGNLTYPHEVNRFIYYRKENGRTGSALNLGIKKSKGKWIHWLSADDMLQPSGIEKMMIHIKPYTEEQQKNAIFYSNYYIVDQHGIKLHEWIEPDRSDRTQEVLQQELLSYFYGNGSTSMIRREVFEKIGLFREDFPYFEDYEFWLRACIVYNMRMIGVPEFTVRYRNHDGMLTKKIDMQFNDVIKKDIMELKNGGTPKHPTYNTVTTS
jgi:glycosyltransferase involved in cell wall biosynthesis